jgi:hypothetical protein
VGDRTFGDVAEELKQKARALAQATNVELLGVRFTGRDGNARLLSVSCSPSLGDSTIAEAVRDRLLS